MDIAILITLLCCPLVNGNNTYGFFKNINWKVINQDTRRIFGGFNGNISDYPGICLLTGSDRDVRCTGAIVTPRFVVTAAHCVTPELKYVYYNNRVPKRGDYAYIKRAYRHPGFNYVIVDEGRGSDVTQLDHDIGLVETRTNMVLAHNQSNDFFGALRTLPANMTDSVVEVLGFGVTSSSGNNEELLAVKLRVEKCERRTWQYCMCGTALPGGHSRGVCAGDSGGPVLLNGTLIALTSMGPVECSSIDSEPGLTATSVFTLVKEYEDLIRNTIDHNGRRMMKEVHLSSTSHSSYKSFSVSDDADAWAAFLFVLLKILQ